MNTEFHNTMRAGGGGVLFWLTGLSGAGKTTIGKELYFLLRAQNKLVVYLEGDGLREVFGAEDAYSLEDRVMLGLRYAKLCKMLVEQDVSVVFATISMFEEVWNWNRENVLNYREIYVRVPLEILIRRDQKELYSRALKGEIDQVMGVDMKFSEPLSPDMVIDNDGKQKPCDIAKEIVERFDSGSGL